MLAPTKHSQTHLTLLVQQKISDQWIRQCRNIKAEAITEVCFKKKPQTYWGSAANIPGSIIMQWLHWTHRNWWATIKLHITLAAV